MSQPLTEQTTYETNEVKYRCPALCCWLHKRLHGLLAFFGCVQRPPTGWCIPPAEPLDQGELWIVVPTKPMPKSILLVGDWGDSSPEVQLAQLKMQ